MQVSERPLGCSPGSCSSATPSTPSTSTPAYDAGVLTLRIPVAEQAKPRRIEVRVTSAEEDLREIKA